MIKSVTIRNFRSVEDQTIDLAPLTFLYGNNAAGKSSLFYALNVLRNVVFNPNQTLDSFFNLGFANLGSFRQIVFKHEEERAVSISISTAIENIDITYGVKLHQKKGEFFLELGKPYSLKLDLPVTFPYPLNGNVQGSITLGENLYNVSWNGVVGQVTPGTVTDETNRQARTIALVINKAAELIRLVDLVPLKRGFSKPYYSPVSVNQFPITEDEVASMLITDEYLDGKVNTYLEQIIERQFRLKTQTGTALVALTTIEKDSKITTDIVNDGFGINQLVYLLAKILHKGAQTLCIEEPEVNLHPGIIRRLPRTFIEVVKDENRQVLISTHSETLIISVLSAIARKDITPTDIAFYLTTRTKGVTSFNKQEISEDGRVESGLASFITGELDDIKAFFKSTKPARVKKGVTTPDIAIAPKEEGKPQNETPNLQ